MTNIQEIDKEKMDSLQVLAQTNVDIGKAKSELSEVKKLEEAYLEEREKKAVAVVQKVLDESKDLLAEALKNYQIIKELGNTASSFAGFLVEIHESLKVLIRDFDEKSATWEADVKKQSEEFESLRNQIKVERVLLENDKDALKAREQEAQKEDKRLKDERGTLDRAIKRLKENRV